MLDPQPKPSASRSIPGQDIPANRAARRTGGVSYRRMHTREGTHPFDEVEWDLRCALISNERGEVVFEQKDVEVPRGWSQLATNIVVQKYFRGTLGTPER